MSSKISPQDQQRVNSVIHSGVNDVERKPFRPWLLLGIILLVLTALSGISFFIARTQGVV